MLLSMTGFGSARHESEGIHTAVEIRSVNHRYFKLVLRANEPYHLLEPEIEQAVRQYVRRGTVQVQLQVVKQPSASDYLLNRVAVRRYYEQLRELHRELGLDGEPELEDVLVLPGVASSAESMLLSPRVDWAVIQPALEQALHHLQQSRRREGEALTQELRRLEVAIREQVQLIRQQSSGLVERYRRRLQERVQQILAEQGLSMQPADLLREVAIFADRVDIGEELVRLESHLDQFLRTLDEVESPGRKLDFLCQEMFRETNTIGAKAQDAWIAQAVVEIKTLVEKIRELVQNVE
ncbi:hypothetical protein HRbin36_01800 [bacterium HR36]|nr:hypothetical protein HRbin36_01800 [bacterium HR36]